ncbi:MAG: hypothetical protein AAGJ87_16975, partial [Pseudomonadota bacterium]
TGATSGFSPYCYEDRLASLIQKYIDDGYEIVAASDAYLGPGQRCGELINVPGDPHIGISGERCLENVARGGAFIAYRPDFSDIAHVDMSVRGRASKGGAAGSATPEELGVVDFSTPADLLKEEEEDAFQHNVDLRSGRLSLGSGALITAGSGEFPYALPFSRTFQGGAMSVGDTVWSHNWHMPLSISGSGNEALGASRGLFASQTIAFLAAADGLYSGSTAATEVLKQETIGAIAAAWWNDSFGDNTVSAAFNAQTVQFVRKLDTQEFYPAEGGAARLTQSGARYMGLSYYQETENPSGHFTALVWRRDNLSFTLTNAGRDTISYDFWRGYYREPWQGIGPVNETIPDKTGWHATQWSFPSGVDVTLSYEFCLTGAATCHRPRLLKVENNLGRELTFTGDV